MGNPPDGFTLRGRASRAGGQSSCSLLLFTGAWLILMLGSGATFAQTPTPGDLVINEVLADPAPDLSGDANGDGVRDAEQDEFIEIVNVSGVELDISGLTLNDDSDVRHTFPSGTIVPPVCTVVVFGGGSPSGVFGGARVETATTGSLSLNNSGESVRLMNGTADIATFTYGQTGCEGDEDQSVNLFPDLFYPSCILHGTAPGSGGSLFSPGTRIDDTPFGDCGVVIFVDGFESGSTLNWSSTTG